MLFCQPLSNRFSDIFAPLPAGLEPFQAAGGRDGFARTADYFSTTQGAWDFFRICDQILECAKKIPCLSASSLASLSKTSKVVNLSGISLSMPLLISGINTFRKDIATFAASRHLPQGDPLRDRRITQAGRDALLSGINLGNTTSQAALFAHQANLINLGRAVPGIDTLYQGSSIVLDGAELIQESYKLSTYVRGDADRKRLSCMVIAKDVASIGTAVLALVGIFFSLTVTAAAVVAWATFFLSAVWLASKIASHFYGQIVQERYG
ncbi:MAG: hypothetical protein HYZ48_05160 [Chlamydiales bacterium]|nr:hypothetical protein [Chlamydiales bacterium]